MSDDFGTPTFIEIGSTQPQEVAPFFAELFGWTFSAMDDSGNGWFDTPSIKIGLHGGDFQQGMVPYFKVPDIEKAREMVRSLGGSAEDLIADEEGFGRFCNCEAPGGVKFGLHQTSK